MAVNESLTAYKRTAANNTPAGSDSVGPDLDDHLRDIKKNIIYASQRPTKEISANYSASLGDHTRLLLVDASAGAVTVTLPAADTASDGYHLAIKKIDSSSNAVTIDGDGAETIDGTASFSLVDQHEAVDVVSNGTNHFISNKIPNVLRTAGGLNFSSTASFYAKIDVRGPISANGTTLGDGQLLSVAAGGETATAWVPHGHIYGLTASHAVDTDHDITVAAGEASLDDNTAIWKLASATTKQIDAVFADGSDVGGLFNGTSVPVAANTLYYRFLTRKDSDGTISWGWSTSSTASNIPAGYTAGPMIGYSYTDASANILWDIGASGFRGKWKMAKEVSIGTAATFDINYIPSWVTRIKTFWSGVSDAGGASSRRGIRIGDSGGIETASYVGGGVWAESGSTTGMSMSAEFLVNTEVSAGLTLHGELNLQLINSTTNTWLGSGYVGNAGNSSASVFGGVKSLSAALDRIQMFSTTAGFDAGNVFVVLES